jgi:hypothetical protein
VPPEKINEDEKKKRHVVKRKMHVTFWLETSGEEIAWEM